MRIVLLAVIYMLTLISTDVSIVFGLVGSLFGPILGLILPVYFKLSYFKKTGRRSGVLMRLHDWAYLAFSVVIGFVGVYFSIMHESEEGRNHRSKEGKAVL